MIKQFGYTWWGKQWLNSFNHIDHSNRLPRGKSYARKGRAHTIAIDGNTVTAKVDGSASRPYRVSVSVTPFTAQEKDIIVDAVINNPLFLSQLLARELPTRIHETLSRQRIDLFPGSWRDMDAKCSCPDYAMPCKHIAAVIYLIANEIDKNPFLVFELHDLDLLQRLQKEGFTDENPAVDDIPSVRTRWEQLLPEPPERSETTFPAPDLSRVPACRDELLSLLTPNPLFYPGKDFKEVLHKTLKARGKEAKKALTATKLPEPPTSDLPPEAVAHIQLALDKSLTVTEVRFRRTDGEETKISTQPLTFLTDWLAALEPERLSRYAPDVQAYSLLYRTSLVLVRQGAIVPQIFALGNDVYAIHWLPALLNQAVQQVTERLATHLPPGSLTMTVGGKSRYFSEADQATYLLATLITHLVRSPFGEGDTIPDVFFGPDTLRARDFESREYPVTIYLWLRRFYLYDKNVVPVIRIREEEPETADVSFIIDMLVKEREGKFAEPVPLAEVFEEPKFRDLRRAVLPDLSLLSSYFPQLASVITGHGPQELTVDGREFAQIFTQTLPVIRLLGIDILLPKSLQHLLRPTLSMTLDAGDEKGITKHFLNMDELLRYRWQVSIGDEQMDADEFLQLVRGLSGVVKIRDQYVYLDPKEIRQLVDKLENPPELSGKNLLQTALAEEYEGSPIKLSKKAQKLLRSMMKTDTVATPTDLHAQLRPYQQRGYAWLYKNSRLGFGSIIADDMGLGKTLQVIAMLLKFKEEGQLDKKKALVVVPTTLLTNWQKEMTRFAPALRWHTYHGPQRAFPGDDFDVLLTTYGIARSDVKALNKIKWHSVIIDEAQNIKNPGTAQTKALKKLKSDVRIAMSGTPVENRLSEYWSIMDFTNKGYLGSLKPFLKEYSYPIEVEQDQHQLENFKRVMSPFILRRLKTDKTIITDLPDKITTNEYCHLTKEQAAVYQNVVDEIMKQVEEKDGIERRGLVFKLIIALKQICNHPVQYLKRGKADIALSGKATRLMELLDELYEQGEKVLIFSQFREMGTLLQQFISETYHRPPLFLHGGSSRKKRDQLVEDFQQQPEINTMILSLKAGGTGLNLTEANHVVHYDLWWNPAVEAQATDRAYRIGQQRNVFVHRMITEGTFEEKINQMLIEKRDLADMAVSQGEQWIGELSNKDLKGLFTL